ncbi:hypothetical protein [Bremerella cremea]|nr:hypothetical protein [Bremerella cremea]
MSAMFPLSNLPFLNRDLAALSPDLRHDVAVELTYSSTSFYEE